MSVCISFTYLGVKWVMFALAQELNTSEQSPRNILPIKSIARATSCFVANAKTHNAFPQNSFLARAVYHKELFARQMKTSNPPCSLAASGACGEGLLQEMPKEFQASYQTPQLRKLPWGLLFVGEHVHVFVRRTRALLQGLQAF